MKNKSYTPKDKRKKILLISDDIRMNSGISTMARELVIGTVSQYNWVNLGGAINHPDMGKKLDISADTANISNIPDASVFIYPYNGYGDPEILRQLIALENPDALMLFTDPRYFVHIFQMENEIRKKIPIFYLNIWDDYPAPIYNKAFYESCDLLMAISKQTRNINRLVLGDKAKDKVITYLPHGINAKQFFPINEFMKEESSKLEEMKNSIFKKERPEFVIFYNSRNIRRKCASDLIAAYSLFCDSIGKEKAKKCALLMHTQRQDENGTNLDAVIELLCDPEYQKVYFTNGGLSPEGMNLLYNIADATALISSNEGWGLSLTESMMAGKMIIANVTGGMQDQMRFEDDNGNWIDFDENFCSNHFGTYKKHGKWSVPVFPTNMSLVGSIPTPYIFDDRVDFRDVAKAIEEVYNMNPTDRTNNGLLGRDWVMSEEAKMNAEMMCSNFVEHTTEAFNKFTKRKSFELIKTEKTPRKKLLHKLVY